MNVSEATKATKATNVSVSEATNVSILMPIYNGANFLNESVMSILNQTLANWELLIAINGHPQNSNTYEMACEYIGGLRNTKIRVFDYHECKGKAATLNRLIGECKYDYVALLDVDDIWLPEKLATQLPYLMQNYDVIGTKCVYFGDMNNVVPNTPTGDITWFNFLHVNPVINSSAIIRTTLAQWDVTIFGVEDYDLWLKLWWNGKRFFNCDAVLVKHRIHQASAFNSKGNDSHVAALRKKYTKA